MTTPITAAALFASEVVTWNGDTALRSPCSVPTSVDVRELMWRCCGLLREGPGLRDAVSRLEAWRAAVRTMPVGVVDDERIRSRSIVTVGVMIARAALRREESRGGHFRSDFPNRDDIKWRKHVADRLTT
jgi:L-aspartate oxidase